MCHHTVYRMRRREMGRQQLDCTSIGKKVVHYEQWRERHAETLRDGLAQHEAVVDSVVTGHRHRSASCLGILKRLLILDVRERVDQATVLGKIRRPAQRRRLTQVGRGCNHHPVDMP